MSSRWSYGPEGLRERPAKRWSDADLLPRWRDLQPILIRSAGVVGLVATIMAVVSSDGLRFGEGIALTGRNNRADDASSEKSAPAPVVAAASELNGEGATEQAHSVPATVAALEIVEQRAAPVATPPSLAATPPARAMANASAALPVPDLRTERGSEPAPIAMASLQKRVSASEIEKPSTPGSIPLAELRTQRARPSSGSSAPLTTASVSATEDFSESQPFSATLVRPATIAAAPPVVDSTKDESSVWADGAATCRRDWVGGDAAHPAGAVDCAATTELIASVAGSDQSALEEAAAIRAETLAALAPRIPAPRPEMAPVVKKVRLSRVSSDWPASPPPDCAAGKHAKWRFVDRRAGTKEWYCR